MRYRRIRLAIVAGLCSTIGYTWNETIAAAQPPVSRALPASRPIPYFIAVGSEQAGFLPGDRQLALWALDAWRRSAGALQLVSVSEADALVRVYWAGPQEGQYGEMRPLVVGGQRGAAVFIRPDMGALGDEIAVRARADGILRDSIVYLTCLHELGHAFGLEHTRDFRDIMYFFGYGGDIVEYFARYRRQLNSREDIGRTPGLSAADVMRIEALYTR
jgi:hypothetical protein